jgi:hypothetical protein
MAPDEKIKRSEQNAGNRLAIVVLLRLMLIIPLLAAL